MDFTKPLPFDLNQIMGAMTEMERNPDRFMEMAAMFQPLHPEDPDYRQKLIERHMRSYPTKRGKNIKYIANPQLSNQLKKPANLKPNLKLAECAPIYINGLKLNTTHRSRVLKGKIIARVFCMTNVHTIIEDDMGDVVKISFPIPPIRRLKNAGYDVESAAILESIYPMGSRLAIIEPFYKIFQDNTFGVRVDSIEEVVSLNEKEKTMDEWKEEGNKHYKRLEYVEAIACYTRGLEVSEKLASTLLENAAIAYGKMENYTSSLVFGLACINVNPKSAKA
ncbi:hypothetical protein HDV05_002197, partial [Chytridiales sp. JEL 0842]